MGFGKLLTKRIKRGKEGEACRIQREGAVSGQPGECRE